MIPDRLERLPVRDLGDGLRVFGALTRTGRLLGLAGLDELGARDSLLLVDCGSIHTFGMRFAIDAIFLDARCRPLRVVFGLRPGRIASCRRARSVLETRAGAGATFAAALERRM